MLHYQQLTSFCGIKPLDRQHIPSKYYNHPLMSLCQFIYLMELYKIVKTASIDLDALFALYSNGRPARRNG